MSLFGRKDSSRQASQDQVDSRPADVTITDPGFDQADPRQLLYRLLSTSGLSCVLSGPKPIEDLLVDATNVAPSLLQSAHRGRGLLQLDHDPETVWTAVDGPRGSAVVVICSPSSDTSFILEAILNPFQRAANPHRVDMVHLGATAPDLAELLSKADVVPVWDNSAYSHINTQGYTTLPAWARRAARSWERPSNDVYARAYTDSDGDEITVVLAPLRDSPALAIGLGGVVPTVLERIVADGPYFIEQIEESAAFARVIPKGTDALALDELSQTMVRDLAHKWAQINKSNGDHGVKAALPLERSHETIWARLERLSGEWLGQRSTRWPALAPYTVTERVRESIPEDDSTFDTVNTLAHQLRADRGSGFEHTWRASGDSAISQPWLSVLSACIDFETGWAVACGHQTHGVWGLPPAYDLGAIDGRNLFTFSEQGHADGLYLPPANLYFGSSRSGAFIPIDGAVNVISVDLHGTTGSVASLEFLGGSTGSVSIYDSSGQRKHLTVTENVAGNEPIRFSGDGSWLLIGGSRVSTLVEVSSGRSLVLDIGNTGWWTLEGSTLITVEHGEGRAIPKLFSLATNTYTRAFPQITLDVPLLAEYPYLWFPAVSPDGKELLALTPAGVSSLYQREHGSGHHLARITLATGQGKLVQQPFIGGRETLERDLRECRWTRRPPVHEIELHAALGSKLRPPVTDHEYLSPSRWADQMAAMLILNLNRAIELHQG